MIRFDPAAGLGRGIVLFILSFSSPVTVLPNYLYIVPFFLYILYVLLILYLFLFFLYLFVLFTKFL